ncbi:MAG: zinc ribbon domain-containing protein [Anaerolineales bacterium]
MSVDIWPEYDQPAVLMIYHITLVSGTALPVSLMVRIPLDAQVNAVAVVDMDGEEINTPYSIAVQGQWLALKITTNSLQVQIEYYVPLVKSGPVRHIVFNWLGDYEVDNLETNFLCPFGAENVNISFAPVYINSGQEGLTNYRVQATNLAFGKPFSLSIDYQRQTDDLSISGLPIQAASTPGPDTPGRLSMTNIYPWVLGGIGVLLILFGIVGINIWQRGGQGSAVDRQYIPHRKGSESGYIYCHQCGKRAQSGDVFCRTCGTRLKKVATD